MTCKKTNCAECKKQQTCLDRTEGVTEIAGQLKLLRGNIREAGECFILRREGEIETLIEHLAALPLNKADAISVAINKKLRKLKLKPQKGRLRDLKEIDGVIEDLMDILVASQEVKERPARERKKAAESAASP